MEEAVKGFSVFVRVQIQLSSKRARIWGAESTLKRPLYALVCPNSFLHFACFGLGTYCCCYPPVSHFGASFPTLSYYQKPTIMIGRSSLRLGQLSSGRLSIRSALSSSGSALTMGQVRSSLSGLGRFGKGFHSTASLLDEMIIKVPTMGDSITEGTIVEWNVEVGSMVNEGDVVALIETDKVTVDIKAEVAGVMVARFGEVDDNVDVGADFYTLDADAEAVAAAPVQEAAAPAAVEQPAGGEGIDVSSSPPVAAAAPAPTSLGRKPSIQFMGKAGWARRLAGEVQSPIVVDANFDMSPSSLPPDFGRPAITEAEIEALELGMEGELTMTAPSQYATWA